jgi:hypothetical protein
MINYTIKTTKAKTYDMDKSKRNILIIGQGETDSKRKIILNPIEPKTAKMIYGETSELYNAYKVAYDITNDSNIYTVNCKSYTDFIEISDTLIQYDFDFIIPIGYYLNDKFYNPVNNKMISYIGYYLNRFGSVYSNAIIVTTAQPSHLYDDIDEYLYDMKKLYKDFKNENSETVNLFGKNLIFVLNNLNETEYPHVVLAATLSKCDFKSYPKNISHSTYFDIDHLDLYYDQEICYHKYYTSQNNSSIENLNNFLQSDNIYKRVLIDLLIKYVVKKLDLTEFNGMLFNPYVKVKIDKKVATIMDSMKENIFVSYKVNRIAYIKTGPGVGNVIVDLSIVPFSILENINIIMEL